MLEQTSIRLGIFISVLIIMVCLELVLPRRKLNLPKMQRWTTNLTIVLINSIVLRLLGPVSAVVAADYALDNSWGLLSLSPVPLPFFVEIAMGVILLDLAIYGQHVASHKFAIFWRFHKMHHADRDIDATTGTRFHPIEAALSMLYKCLVILALGPITLSVIAFEIVLNASAMFNHANVRLPLGLDRTLRQLIVTPDFHRVHHSVIPCELNTNYGFFLSIWDRLFRTHTAQPKFGHDKMTVGLEAYQTEQPASLAWSIALPFVSSAATPKQNKNRAG